MSLHSRPAKSSNRWASITLRSNWLMPLGETNVRHFLFYTFAAEWLKSFLFLPFHLSVCWSAFFSLYTTVQRGMKLQEQIVIGTPGTMLDWCGKFKFIDPKKIKVFVLDEADVMIDTQGHQDQSIRIQRSELKRIRLFWFRLIASLWLFKTHRS